MPAENKSGTCRMAESETADASSTGVGLSDDAPLGCVTCLSEGLEVLEAVLADARDGFVVLGAAGDVEFVNSTALAMLGDRTADVIGQQVVLEELLGIDSDKPLSEGESHEVELNEPTHRIVLVRIDPACDRSGARIGSIVNLHDVTAEREIALMKNEFVSMVSHELRTPLTSIKGYVDLIVDGQAGEINEIQREFLQIVQENSDRLVALINDLLDISRIESGRVHLKIEPVDMADVVESVADTFRTMAEQSGVQLSCEFADELPRAAADRDRIGQVLMNFVSNAIKYSPQGGDVTVYARPSSDNESSIVVEVRDTGIGIAEEDQASLFSKFFRVDSSLTREIGGTGLGLSICRSVVELHGGCVGADSRLGEGSTFWFSVPIAAESLARTPRVEGPLGEQGGSVLVVDSSPRVTDLIGTYLEQRGYDVLKAHSATEAFNVAVRERPRAITLDVLLEDADGFELLRRLREDDRTSDIPVAVVSVVCDESKSLRLGAADYLEKPIDQKRLTKVIDDMVGAMSSPVVLVVDDDRDIVDALTRRLRSKGYAVASAYNGREAMNAIAKQKPDLVLLDLKMPVMDGYEVIHELKTDDATRDIPIVVMTAHHIDTERMDLLRLTADQLAKPLSPEEFAEHIERVLSLEE